MEYPKGAIKSLEEFRSLFTRNEQRTLWVASKSFQVVDERRCTGTTVTYDYIDDRKYIGISFITAVTGLGEFSALDMHILPQDYNDWYVFTSAEDAQEYTGVKLS